MLGNLARALSWMALYPTQRRSSLSLDLRELLHFSNFRAEAEEVLVPP